MCYPDTLREDFLPQLSALLGFDSVTESLTQGYTLSSGQEGGEPTLNGSLRQEYKGLAFWLHVR